MTTWERGNSHKIRSAQHGRQSKHHGIDLVSCDLVCSDLTEDRVGDTTALPGLLDQIDGDVTRCIADGAYEGEPSRDMLLTRFGGDIHLVIPPPKNAILSAAAQDSSKLRDQRTTAIAPGAEWLGR